MERRESRTPPSAGLERRESRTLLSAGLANGPRELLDFVLPLWAGAALGASPAQVGALIAAELAVSVLARPVAGALADTLDRRRVAAAGALLYALSCLGYAVAGGLPVAFGAAAAGGLGGALLWVSVRAMTAERLAEDSAVYPRLTAAEETGAWIAFVAGFAVLSAGGYRAVFLGCAAACVVAAGALLTAPARSRPSASPSPPLRRLRPMLLAVVLTSTAEAAVGLLLLLHLQRGFGLGVVEIAYVFLPGAVAMSVLPERLHRLVLRHGRARVLAAASVASAVFAASLAAAPNPWVIAALWILSGVAWAAVIPIQQAVIAEASGARAGRGMGAYEAATLLGGLIGALAAGFVYEAGSWVLACLLSAAVILLGAVLVPWSVRALGVPDTPSSLMPVTSPGPSPGQPPRPPTTAPAARESMPSPATAPTPPQPLPPPAPGTPQSDETATPPPSSSRADAVSPAPPHDEAAPRASPWRRLGEHAVLFGLVQVGLLVLDQSWLRDLATGGVDLMTGYRDGDRGAGPSFLFGAGRIWTIVFVVDVVWTLVAARRSRR